MRFLSSSMAISSMAIPLYLPVRRRLEWCADGLNLFSTNLDVFRIDLREKLADEIYF